MARFQNNFTEMFLGWSSTKIAKMVLVCWTKWLPELKMEKPLNERWGWPYVHAGLLWPHSAGKVPRLWFCCKIVGTTKILYLPNSGLLLSSCPLSAVYLAWLWWKESGCPRSSLLGCSGYKWLVHTRVVQKVLSLVGFLSFIPGIF